MDKFLVTWWEWLLYFLILIWLLKDNLIWFCLWLKFLVLDYQKALFYYRILSARFIHYSMAHFIHYSMARFIHNSNFPFHVNHNTRLSRSFKEDRHSRKEKDIIQTDRHNKYDGKCILLNSTHITVISTCNDIKIVQHSKCCCSQGSITHTRQRSLKALPCRFISLIQVLDGRTLSLNQNCSVILTSWVEVVTAIYCYFKPM